MKRIKFNHNQLSLPFSQIRAASITYEGKEKAFWVLCLVCLCSVIFYIYAINATAHHIAVRENLEDKVAELALQLSTLEFAAISLKNSITMERASELGFRETKTPLYISKTPNISLTLNARVR